MALREPSVGRTNHVNKMNFLPLKDQTEIKKQYKKRFFLGLILFLFFLGLINIILIFPPYLLLRLENGNLKKQSLAGPNEAILAKSKDTETSLKNLYADIEFLKNLAGGSPLLAPLIYELTNKIRNGINGVSIESINFENNAAKEKNINKISLFGKARTRDAFLAFLSNLKTSDYFKEINSPPQNILKNEDIDYRIEIFLKTNE